MKKAPKPIGYTVQTEWDYTQERPYKGDVIKDKRRIYIHYFYSIEKVLKMSRPLKNVSSVCAGSDIVRRSVCWSNEPYKGCDSRI